MSQPRVSVIAFSYGRSNLLCRATVCAEAYRHDYVSFGFGAWA